MIFAIVTLAVSFLAMIAMLGAKHYEMKAGRQIIAVEARKRVENGVRHVMHVAWGMVQVAVTKRFWTDLLAFICRKFVEKVWRHPHMCAVTKKAVDVVKGKKEIKSKGPVSFYLKDVSDYKKQVR